MLFAVFLSYRHIAKRYAGTLLRNQNLMSTGFLSNMVLTCLYAQPRSF